MQNLSKSKLIAFRQCKKRLWLEIHRKDLLVNSASSEANFAVGRRVDELARQLYDTNNDARLIDRAVGFTQALSASILALKTAKPVFEAGFSANGALSFADIMLPKRAGKRVTWRMVEVKAATSVKPYHEDDVAIQAYIAKAAGVPLHSVAVAHINKDWVYPGKKDYNGLLIEHDLSVDARGDEVKSWISAAQRVVQKTKEPAIKTGSHCNTPFPCPFIAHCQSQEPTAEYPTGLLPNVRTGELKALLSEISELAEVPDDALNLLQLRVKTQTLWNEVYFAGNEALAELSVHQGPYYFLDFETINLAVPIWKGTKPYQQIPFQFSLHRVNRNSKIEHRCFIDLSGKNPSKAIAEALIRDCGTRGTIFAYGASFEKTCIKTLAERLPKLRAPLLAIHARIVDLLKTARNHYYHPGQEGSWSIKAVLPSIAPLLNYEALDVQDGQTAMQAYAEAITPGTSKGRISEIKKQLEAYCKLDTFGLLHIWAHFIGRTILMSESDV